MESGTPRLYLPKKRARKCAPIPAATGHSAAGTRASPPPTEVALQPMALTHLVVIFYESTITSEKKRLQLYGHNRFILMTIRDFIQRAPALPK